MRGVGRKFQRVEQMHRLFDHVAAPAGRPEHGRGRPDPLGDRDVDVFQHREPAEQPVDLERPGDAELDPFCLDDARDVAPLEQNRTGGGPEDTGQEIHERGLARAVRADQGVARAGLEPEVDIARGGQRAEVSAERAGLEDRIGHDAAPGARGRRHHGRSLASDGRAPAPRRPTARTAASAIPRMPLRANRAITTSRNPSPSCQAVG